MPAGPGSIHRCSPGGGAWVRAGGVPGVLLNLSFPKCQWDGLEEGGIVILLSPGNGLIRLSAERIWLLCTDLLRSHTHANQSANGFLMVVTSHNQNGVMTTINCESLSFLLEITSTRNLAVAKVAVVMVNTLLLKQRIKTWLLYHKQ